ncbi:acyl-CoA reductase [Lewinella sp. W8]|uniref:acyl-CoA reductase n=1 Tax=Lewinella sp. W8 TaxID=2528208 RepID=UPI0010675D0F|nr:acyl-CoA reductase [Lewinella sp. W8]MTB50082.1 acyl-CoA reductase [Lewinella sp. W8]
MTLQERIDVMVALGDHLRRDNDEFLEALQKRTQFHNDWFTLEHQRASLMAIADAFLRREKLEAWVRNYAIPDWPAPKAVGSSAPKTIGLVLAGNIPLVGFHDVLSVFIAGHRSLIKLSSKDEYVMPYLLKLLAKYDKRTETYFTLTDRLEGFDAVIATGSNNSSRYFEAYFGRYPHVIRKNRNAVAVLRGDETTEDFRALGRDIFEYFGLGCRNVSKLYVPEGYDFNPLLEVLHEWKTLQNHTKWKNNFDYNYALTTLNKENFYLSGPLMIVENDQIASRIATLHYSTYRDVSSLEEELRNRREEIQLIAAPDGFLSLPTFPFGRAQRPGLTDYADGVDTLAFLQEL